MQRTDNVAKQFRTSAEGNLEKRSRLVLVSADGLYLLTLLILA